MSSAGTLGSYPTSRDTRPAEVGGLDPQPLSRPLSLAKRFGPRPIRLPYSGPFEPDPNHGAIISLRLLPALLHLQPACFPPQQRGNAGGGIRWRKKEVPTLSRLRDQPVFEAGLAPSQFFFHVAETGGPDPQTFRSPPLSKRCPSPMDSASVAERGGLEPLGLAPAHRVPGGPVPRTVHSPRRRGWCRVAGTSEEVTREHQPLVVIQLLRSVPSGGTAPRARELRSGEQRRLRSEETSAARASYEASCLPAPASGNP